MTARRAIDPKPFVEAACPLPALDCGERAAIAKPAPKAPASALSSAAPGISTEANTYNGVTVNLSGSIGYHARNLKVTPREALFVGLLARAFGSPVNHDFLVKRVWARQAVPRDAAGMLDIMAAALSSRMMPLGLEIKVHPRRGHRSEGDKMKRRIKQSPRQRELINRKRAAKRKLNAGAQLRQGGKPRSARSEGKDRPGRPDPFRAPALRSDPGVALYESARAALAAARSVDEVLKVRDAAERMRLYARQAKDRDLLADAVEIHLRAQRRLGEMLVAAKAAGQVKSGRPADNPSMAEGLNGRVKLQEAGIDHKLSMKAQRLAALDASAFDESVQLSRERIIAGAAAIIDPRSLEKAAALDAAAKADPEGCGPLADNMRRTGSPDGPFKQLQTRLAAAEIRKKPPPAPGQGPYCGVVIDFPWAAEPEDDDPDRLARGYYPYPTMSISEIQRYCSDVIRPVLDACAVIGIWIPNYHLALGHQLPVLGALELKASTILTWRKNLIGRGQVARGSTEHVIIARRGKAVIETPFPRTDFDADVDRKNHSRKPQLFFDLFQKHVPAPRYASFFDTVDRGPLWDVHGAPHKKQQAEAVAA